VLAAGSSLTLCKDAEGSFQFGVGSGDIIALRDAGGSVVDTTQLGSGGLGFNSVWARAGSQWAYTAVGQLYVCMNGVLEPGEQCDTGVPDEGCSASCKELAARGIFYADSTVPAITVSLGQKDWDSLSSCPQGGAKKDPPSKNCDYHPADCHLQFSKTDVVLTCLVRRKGSFSWRKMTEKPSLKIKLVKEWRGMKKFTLNNMVQDQTGIHERMAYGMYNMIGVPAPRCVECSVAWGCTICRRMRASAGCQAASGPPLRRTCL